MVLVLNFLDPILVGDAIQVFHLVVAFVIWYFVGRIGSVIFFIIVFLIFVITWIVVDGCPMTLAANDFFSAGGVEGYYCNSFSEQFRSTKDAIFSIEPYHFGRPAPYCDLYEWLRAKTGSQLAIFVKMSPLVALWFGMLITRLKKQGKITSPLLF